jgi:hypothetical protein
LVGTDLSIRPRKRRNSSARWRRGVGDHLTGGRVERRRGGGAVAHVVVAAALGHPGHQRQHRRRGVERLDLGLLVDAEHDRGVGGVEVKADDVSDLVDELRIGRELERLGLVGL